MHEKPATEVQIILGQFTREKVDEILYKASQIKPAGQRIDFISGQFLDIGYGEATLTGSENVPEILVINLQNLDCFTFLDYVEAMSLAGSFSEFIQSLKKVRYRSGTVSFRGRNHFFTDWRVCNADIVDDVTEKIGGRQTVHITKSLNLKEDGTLFVPGIQPVQREILYIPSDRIDDCILDRLRTGDFLGIYSSMKGLDVSHVGIVIRDERRLYLRHASSQETPGKVIDQDLRVYISDKPGMLIFRPC